MALYRKIVLHRDRAPQRRNHGVPSLASSLVSAPGVRNPRCPVASRRPIAFPWAVRSCPLPDPRQGYDVLWAGLPMM
jgi:hypothetical protein